MRAAIAEARAAFREGGDPVGAVVVSDDRIVGGGHNRVRLSGDPTAHAEIEAIRAALAAVGGALPPAAALYTTEEPCPMCLWMSLRCGIRRLVIGARYSDLTDESIGSYRVEALLDLTERSLDVADNVLRDDCVAAHAGRFNDDDSLS